MLGGQMQGRRRKETPEQVQGKGRGTAQDSCCSEHEAQSWARLAHLLIQGHLMPDGRMVMLDQMLGRAV